MTQEQRVVVQRLPVKNPTEAQAFVGEVGVLHYDYTDTGADLELLIDATTTYPVYVREVVHIVRTGSSGTSPTVNVGDGSTADLWIDEADVTDQTGGHVVSSLQSDTAGGGTGSSATLLSGKWYTTAVRIKVTLGGTWTAGAGTVLVYFNRLKPA